MKVTLISGSLDPGRNGVGDYSRSLAAACLAKGHQVQLISLCDAENVTAAEAYPPTYRFTDALSNAAARESIRERIAEAAPDWISLQFVPFAFSKRGFIHRLTPFVTELSALAPLNVMFHELWLGEKPALPVKLKLLGKIQRHQILNALEAWQPKCVHTSNPLYVDVLGRNGIRARRLPLFGNIPIIAPDSARIRQVLPWYPPLPNQRMLLFPFAQSMSWRSDFLMHRLRDFANQAGVTLRLVQVGKNPALAKHWTKIAEFCRDAGWTCDCLGPQDSAIISDLMHCADLGVSSAHPQLSGKSGAVISMLEHGLPVLCTSLDKESAHPVDRTDEPMLLDLSTDGRQIIERLKEPAKDPARSRLSAVAEDWIRSLEESATDG